MSKWKLLDLTVIYIPVIYGGAVANQSIFCKMIASLHDENNHITWFYDNVEELSLKAEKWQKPF
jgi:hypothetical protein